MDNVYKNEDELKPELYEWIKKHFTLSVRFVSDRGRFNPSYAVFTCNEDKKKDIEDCFNIPFSLPASALRESLKAELEKHDYLFKKPKVVARHLKG